VTDLRRLRQNERWIAYVRAGAVVFAFGQLFLTRGYPPGYELKAWIVTVVVAAGAGVLLVASRMDFAYPRQLALSVTALVFDIGALTAYLIVYDFERGSPIRQLLYLVVIEGAVRFGIAGGLVVTVATAPVLLVYEHLRIGHVGGDFRLDYVTIQLGGEAIVGLIVGWLVMRLASESERAERRAAEAEGLRDALGRRVDLLEAANRCARALGASLELEEAFAAFIREVRGVVPFDRLSVALLEGGRLEVLATAGLGADEVFPPGSSWPASEEVFRSVTTGGTSYRPDMGDRLYADEARLLGLGLRARLSAPLLAGAEVLGLISFVRREPDSFTAEEIELASLIGRLAATAVQNIRAYEAERRTVEELRRLSAMRADFVSLVSHELRSPIAAVVGSAQTLQQRWRELSPWQRESFLALIAGETGRLADLISDILDTSRIESGDFSYAFADVDVGEIAEEAAATASVEQDEVPVRATVRRPIPAVRGDRVRLRQLLSNLIDNAVKYSAAGDRVDIDVSAGDGRVLVDVRDRGPGIPRDQQRVIFEKFGRARGGGTKPGTGLGLFIAQSIAEVHGGSLAVRSSPGEGSTFTLTLPGEAAPARSRTSAG
jgi:signal transduction histidine kinase